MQVFLRWMAKGTENTGAERRTVQKQENVSDKDKQLKKWWLPEQFGIFYFSSQTINQITSLSCTCCTIGAFYFGFCQSAVLARNSSGSMFPHTLLPAEKPRQRIKTNLKACVSLLEISDSASFEGIKTPFSCVGFEIKLRALILFSWQQQLFSFLPSDPEHSHTVAACCNIPVTSPVKGAVTGVTTEEGSNVGNCDDFHPQIWRWVKLLLKFVWSWNS